MAKIVAKQYIIAIGASAGGLKAISSFFDYTPLDAVSYILIQHLSSDFKSQMAEILARHSKLEVIEAKENIDIMPNTVYLIPNSKFMTIEKGRLLLSDKKEQSRPYMTIDYFFTSLAKERGDKAIGVILSGTGSDGSKGIQAIKKAGGLILVQDIDSANYKGMPMAAIATECADMVLSPQDMPEVIENYVKEGSLKLNKGQKSEDITEDELGQIFDLIKGNLPLDFSEYKRPTIIRRIMKRMVEQNFTHIDKYYTYLKNNPAEIALLANNFLISVTSFFRDPDAFKIIEEQVLPHIIKNNREVLKIWVAGCATGEEAYSMAILVREHLTKQPKDIEVKIFATDIARGALDIASKGIYPDEKIEKSVSRERLKKYFTKEGSNYKVKHEIRKMLIFAQHDVVKNPPYCNIDLISCRNLLIYLNPVSQKKVFSMMHFGLKKEGYLFLGPSENPTDLKEDFDEISKKWNILKCNKTGRTVRFDSFSSHVVEETKIVNKELIKKNFLLDSKSTLGDQVNSFLYKESGLTGICTDENMRVIKSFGDISPYLRKENFNFNLNELLPDNIAALFKAAVHKALKLDERVLLKGLVFDSLNKSKNLTADILISPFSLNNSADKLLMIVFTKSKAKHLEKNVINYSDISEITKEHLINLEMENAELKQSLAMANESIESSNENMQSYNEELQSANEEMQSANEEMQSTNEELQSVNEELQTINKEHQMTIDELTDLNDDLNNYFRSNTNGQLFVDRDLLLKRYSPAAVKHINIRESDIGRPLSNITTNIKFETLIDDIKKVISEEITITKEAESIDGKIYQVMTMPYLKKNSKTPDGAIISFYDITTLKKLLTELDVSNINLVKSIKISNDAKAKVSQALEKEKELGILKSRFVSMASHEFRTPLSTMQLSASIILKYAEPYKNANIDNHINKIQNSIGSLTAILTDFLSLDKLESGKMKPLQVLFDIVEFGQNITEEMQLIAKQNQKIIYQHIGTTTKVKLDRGLLKNCVINLISNAIKYSGPDTLIDFSSAIDEKVLTLIIKDNGIGIPAGDQKHLFEAFFRAHNTENIQGTGLGLNIVNRYTNLMDGKIKFESKINEGTTFTLSFPI
ncbi:two-component system CheB/CheR fusion protein [Pedobacter sp. UYP30]|uniref:chemotaxis protein CheB n=1 Tax=Pedobacter sp. UYP30 TaxID=1756400 RepID=UPI00339903F2